jgi:hypothetical protein
VDFCDSPPIFLVDQDSDLARKEATVEWSPPLFHDNSLQDVIVDMTMTIGNKSLSNVDSQHVFPIGKTTQIQYQARDESGNTAFCTVDITLQGITR